MTLDVEMTVAWLPTLCDGIKITRVREKRKAALKHYSLQPFCLHTLCAVTGSGRSV
jgi:hypothetical protein